MTCRIAGLQDKKNHHGIVKEVDDVFTVSSHLSSQALLISPQYALLGKDLSSASCVSFRYFYTKHFYLTTF